MFSTSMMCILHDACQPGGPTSAQAPVHAVHALAEGGVQVAAEVGADILPYQHLQQGPLAARHISSVLRAHPGLCLGLLYRGQRVVAIHYQRRLRSFLAGRRPACMKGLIRAQHPEGSISLLGLSAAGNDPRKTVTRLSRLEVQKEFPLCVQPSFKMVGLVSELQPTFGMPAPPAADLSAPRSATQQSLWDL